MQFPSVSPETPRPARHLSLHLITCALLALFSSSLAFATDSVNAKETPTHPPSESQKKDTGFSIGDKQLEKYDVSRIGEREIGRGFNIYSRKRERELGERMAAAFDQTTKLVTDPVVNDYINRLAQKIVRYSDANIPFTVRVIDSNEVPRAYGLPGGFLYVDSGLITTADAEAELAAVMAHEIAHVAARHATRALSRRDLCSMFSTLAMITGPAGAGAVDIGGLAGPLSVKKFSREAEYEADLLGMEYAYAAGYDPHALLDALEKLHAIEIRKRAALANVPGHHAASHVPFHGRLLKSFANYPLTAERIQRLQSEIAAFLPDRSDYILDTGEFEEVRSRLLAARTPVLRHHAPEDGNKGPVLHRTPQDDSASQPLPAVATASQATSVGNTLLSEPREMNLP